MEFNEKQIQIMKVAENLFAEKGFTGTSVRDISDEAKVNLAMISYYFGSKEKLLESIFTYRAENIKLKLETMLQNKKLSSLEKVNILIDDYISRIMEQQCFHKIMVREQIINMPGVTHKLIHQLKKTNQDLVKQLILEGQKRGEFKKYIDVPLMMATLIGTTSHLITTKHYYKEMNGLQSMEEEEFQTHLKKKLSHHLKQIFKAILTYEE
ncbi:MAG: TetR/AcrR family transcriptional regulator [Bacteroidetes bacterium]|nr:TetR/AcrR family transcriptional regulator [Bacteroidota bacterium]MBS1930985.1 TetR/AcrR family transcriptional regulator [Bacteroidota bacterium]